MLVSTELAENILYHLKSISRAEDVAFVEHKNSIYWSESVLKFSVYSSVVILLQNLFDQMKDQSFFILRNRIFYSGIFNNMDLGMIKIVAKRGMDQVKAVNHQLDLQQFQFLKIENDSMNPELFQGTNALNKMELTTFQSRKSLNLEGLTQMIPGADMLHDQDRKIAAVLMSENGKLLSIGFNSNSVNKTLHAEVMMIQKYYYQYSKKIPAGSKIYSTHKPCKMCAGMIYEMSEKTNKPFVYYFKDMSGPMNANSILEQNDLLIKSEGLMNHELK